MICAHGGDTSGGALANTLPAYRAALAHPAVACVEVDVSRTRDDALVALHQRQLLAIAEGEFDRRVADAQRWLSGHSYALTLHSPLLRTAWATRGWTRQGLIALRSCVAL